MASKYRERADMLLYLNNLFSSLSQQQRPRHDNIIMYRLSVPPLLVITCYRRNIGGLNMSCVQASTRQKSSKEEGRKLHRRKWAKGEKTERESAGETGISFAVASKKNDSTIAS